MLRGVVVSLLCLLALPSAAQYNIKKMMEEGRRTLDQGYYVTSMQIFSRRAYCLYQIGDSKTALQQLAYILKRWKSFDAAAQLRSDILAGRKPKQQPVKSNTPPIYQLPSLRIDNNQNPMKNKPILRLSQ